MQIAGRKIGADQLPFIVAEIGANHHGDLGHALALIEAAKEAGADAVKFQAYTADTITIHGEGPEFWLTDGPWQGQSIYQLYKRAETPFAWFPALAKHANDIGIIWFASVFDKTSVDLLAALDVPAFKIASFELVDLPLIRYAASKGKPMILSTGMATPDEIGKAYAAASHDAALLHCVSGYPTPPGEANLDRMQELADFFPLCVGISDHTTGIEVPIAATALGACIIEKHFRLSVWTPDAKVSITPMQFRSMVDSVHRAWAALQPSTSTSEAPQRGLRRSLYAVAGIKAGEVFTEANVRSIRPGAGLPPAELDNVLGKTAARDIAYGTPLAWELISSSSS